MPLTFITYDECLRTRIGLEHLDSFSYGPGYGGTGALRLRQLHGAGDSALWFFAYRLDDHGHRGTAPLQPGDLDRIRLYLPSATMNGPQAGGLRISERDLHALFEAVEADPLETDQINRQQWALEHPPVDTPPSRRSFIDGISHSLKRTEEGRHSSTHSRCTESNTNREIAVA